MRLRTTAAALVVLAVIAAGWSGASPSASGAATTEVAAGSGCGIARGAGTRAHTVRAAGLTRTYHLTVPPGYTGDTRVPLVIDMHGAGSNAGQQALLSRARAEAATRGWIVATPDAGRTLWFLQALGGEDITFIRNVVADVSRRLCINRTRQFAMGMSNGAAMAAALTCAAPDMFAAAASVGGFNIAGPCLERPRPILAIHGTADPTVPYRGGPLSGAASGINLTVPPVTERLREWGIRNQCTSGPTTVQVVPTVHRIAYGGCAARTELLRVRGGGHTWPGGPVLSPDRFGFTSQAIDATEEIFTFFNDTFAPT